MQQTNNAGEDDDLFQEEAMNGGDQQFLREDMPIEEVQKSGRVTFRDIPDYRSPDRQMSPSYGQAEDGGDLWEEEKIGAGT